MTAASPAFRGQLADVDARWNVIAASVDDRTEEERGLKVNPREFSLAYLADTGIVAAERRSMADTEVAVRLCGSIHFQRRAE